MAKAVLKTQKTTKSVSAFLATLDDDQKRKDSEKLVEIMSEVSGDVPAMWGENIIGFGSYSYKYASGREGDWFCIGFSPRKAACSIYIMPGYQDFDELLEQLGSHKKGKCCLYIKRLSDVNESILKAIMKKGYEDLVNEGREE